jgi:hypothetical protein
VAEKVSSHIDAPRTPSAELSADDEAGYAEETERTVIHDTVDGRPAAISLAVAIEHLQPCNWNFARNLAIVLAAIGGDTSPEAPFACCARNITLTPIRERMREVAADLRGFSRSGGAHSGAGRGALSALGEPTPAKRWLAASLAKTLELQLRL